MPDVRIVASAFTRFDRIWFDIRRVGEE